MTKEEVVVMRNKILLGIELAYQRLLIEKQKDDSDLVFSHNGKIVAIKASDLIKKYQEEPSKLPQP